MCEQVLPSARPSEAQRNDLADTRQRMELARNIAADRVVDGDQCDRFAGLLPPSEVEGRDVDSVLSELRPERSDEAWLVVVDDVDHLAGELGLDRNAEDFDQPRRAIAEERALDAFLPVLGPDRHGYQGVVVAFAL